MVHVLMKQRYVFLSSSSSLRKRHPILLSGPKTRRRMSLSETSSSSSTPSNLHILFLTCSSSWHDSSHCVFFALSIITMAGWFLMSVHFSCRGERNCSSSDWFKVQSARLLSTKSLLGNHMDLNQLPTQ